MSYLTELGFKVNTKDLVLAQKQLDRTTAAGGRLDKAAISLGKSLALVATGMLAVTSAGSAVNTIFKFDEAMKGLQATSRSTAKEMEAFEKQARSLGATSRFSATQAAEAQRFLAMAGFTTNEILASTASVLKLAVAGELDLASAADIASNALGGLQLSVSEIDRVVDVMADTAASANTNISQLAVALRNSAPIATAAGVEMEELVATIGALSDAGIQAERAGTGVLGIIRQLSNVTTDGAKILAKYGLSVSDLSIEANGLTSVMGVLGKLNLSAGDAIKIFGSEAAAAGLIVAQSSDRIAVMTERYKNASGSATEMSDILAGSLTSAALGLGSAMSELALQAGDAGLEGALKSSILGATGLAHAFTGMLPEFASVNNLTDEYVDNLNDIANGLTATAGAVGGVVAVMGVARIATLGLSASIGILNAVMLANPIALVIGSVAALAGGLYAAKDITIGYGRETVKVLDLVQAGFATVSDGFNTVADLAISTYDSITGLFSGIAENAASTANSLGSNFSASFGNIYDMAKWLVNGVIGTFITLGKSIGIIAAHMTESFSNAFTNIKNLGGAAWKDLTAALSGSLGTSNITQALENALYTPVSQIFSDISKEAEQAFNVDYIGGAASSLGEAVDFVTSKFDAYVISISTARKEAKAMADEQAELNNVLDEIFGNSSGNALEKIPKVTEDLAQDLSGLTEEIDGFGGAWTRTGNIVVDTFGNMADAMKDYSSRMEDLNKLQEKVNKKRKESSADNVALDKLQMKINDERALAEIDGYQAAASAAAGAFSEKTVAARAFGAINQALALAEIAMTYQKIAAGTAETGVHIANEGAKQSSNALTAITSAFAAPFPVNFVAGAAMIGIMSSLLGSSSGSSGGGGGSTTGTALGGGASESLDNVNSSLEDIMIDQLAELRGLRSDLNSADNQAFALFKTLLNDTRDHDEITNPYERKLEDSFDALNGDRNSNADYVDQLRGVFDSVESILSESIDTLGINTTRSLQTFLFDVGTISFDNLDADEAEKRLGEILSSQSDLMAQHLIPSITRFQQVGEGAFETLVRVTKEQVTFNDSINQMGISLGDLSSTLQVDVAQSVIDLVGGFDNFTDFVGEFTDEFLTDTQKMENMRGSLTDVFDSVGLSLSTTREGFSELVSGIDVSTIQGQELLATLLEISPAMADYIGALEDLSSEQLGLQIDLLDAQGESLQALTLSRQAELEATDESLRSLLEQIFAQEDLNKAREAEVAALEDARSLLENNVAFAEQQLLSARDAELSRIDLIIQKADEAYNLELDAINAQRDAYSSLIIELESIASNAANNVSVSLAAELSKYDERISAANNAASEEISIIQTISSARIESLNSELSIAQSVANTLGSASNSFSANEALSAARAGSFSESTNIQSGTFNTSESRNIGQAREAFALNEIGKLADAQVSDLQKTINATEAAASEQVIAVERSTAAISESLESQKSILESQVNKLLGIDGGVLSLNAAVFQYQKADLDLQKKTSSDTLQVLLSQEKTALESFELSKTQSELEAESLEAQVNSLLNIDTSVLSVADAISMLAIENQALADLDYSNQIRLLDAQYDTIDAINDYIPPPPPEPATSDDATMQDLVDEIKSLRADLDNANQQIGENTKLTADTVRKLEFLQSVN